MPGGTLKGSDQEGAPLAFPLPNWPRKTAWLSDWVLRPQRSSPGFVGPWGIGGRPGENRRGRWKRSSRMGGTGKAQKAFVHTFGPRKPAGLLGQVPHPPRPEARLGSFCWVEPKPHPHHTQGLFQPCGS